MNELTKKLQQVMVPKAALIAYEYSDGRYGHGTYYLELHPINDRGRMEAAVPVTYEFMDSLVEYYTCLLYTSPSPRDGLLSRMPSSA